MWEFKEQAVSIPIMDDLIKTTIDNRMSRMAEEMTKSMYGDELWKPAPPTIRQRIGRKIERIHDAWLVLTGKADIGGW